jgi:predicted metal-dependent phosphoesterase TrpH
VDLHLHSTASDGSASPTEVVARAAKLGLRAISLTDHDSVGGVSEAQAAGARAGVEVVPGTELSAQVEGRDVHILGYLLDAAHPEFLASLNTYRDERANRAQRMVKKLNAMGVRITFEQVAAKAAGGAIGRPHVADVLVEEGICFSANQAFQKYLGYGRAAYEEKYAMTPSEAARVIHNAGGLAVLAHPGLYGRDDLLPALADEGLDGIEVWHIKHDAAAVARYAGFAESRGLIQTGGSDCHGDGRGEAVMGRVEVGYEVLEEMRRRQGGREIGR